MAEPQYSTLFAAVTSIPDPRKARGKRYPWTLLLTVILAGLASNYQTARAMADWVRLTCADWQTHIPCFTQPPSESTLLRTIRAINVEALERHVAAFVAQLPDPVAESGQVLSAQGELLEGHALDGKTVRTTTAHGNRTHLVSEVVHGSGRTVAQMAVPDKRTEVLAARTLLAKRDLSGIVFTMDAGLTHRGLAQDIRTNHGHYLMICKQNHPQMYAELQTFFALPGIVADAEWYDEVQTISKGHGRLETRRLRCLRGQCVDWRWPDCCQVIERTCTRTGRVKGVLKRSVAVSYGLTSILPEELGAPGLEHFWRGHWTIENRKHYVRDVTMGEDRHPMHRGTAPQTLTVLRNGLIDLWRSHGWHYISDAVRWCATSLSRTLQCIGVTQPTLT